jgi:hypothetical protein
MELGKRPENVDLGKLGKADFIRKKLNFMQMNF